MSIAACGEANDTKLARTRSKHKPALDRVASSTQLLPKAKNASAAARKQKPALFGQKLIDKNEKQKGSNEPFFVAYSVVSGASDLTVLPYP